MVPHDLVVRGAHNVPDKYANSFMRCFLLFILWRAAIAPLVEAFAFTAVVLVDIWFLHSRTWWGDALPAVFALVSFVAHRDPLSDSGFVS